MQEKKREIELKIWPEELITELAQILRSYQLEAWEIYLLMEQGTLVEVREQKIEALEKEEHLGVALRVLKGQKLGFGYSTDFRNSSLRKLVEEIFSRMKQSDPDSNLQFPECSDPLPELPEIYDPSFSLRSEREKILKAMEMEQSALRSDARIKRVRECQYEDNLREIWLRNSLGLNRTGRATHFQLAISAVAEQGKEAQISSEFDWSFQYDMLSPERVGKGAALKAITKLGGKRLKSQKAPVIFAPEVAGELMELLSYALSGENLAKNKTWLQGMEGKKIFSEAVTIIDDGTWSYGPECFAFDGEGVNSQRKVLVAHGVLEGFIFDHYYGRKLKKSSTGNARRENFFFHPSVGPSNFYLAPGTSTPEELISSVRDGLLIKEALGMHTADEISGEFSIGVSGQWIKNGKLAQPVSGVAIAGTLKELLAQVKAVGNDLKFYQRCASPSLLIEELEISGI